MTKIQFNFGGSKINFDDENDSNIEEISGKLIERNLEDTIEFTPVTDEELFQDTDTNIFGGEDDA